ncbi:MAG: hypothetical protein PHE67_05085 [Campylobacterales bacterium]|nr:hypothetical protein [Campylobacterales bacterium]
MASSELNIKISVKADNQAVKSLDESFGGLSKSIDSAKSRMLDMYKTEALYTSEIKRLRAELKTSTGSIENGIKSELNSKISTLNSIRADIATLSKTPEFRASQKLDLASYRYDAGLIGSSAYSSEAKKIINELNNTSSAAKTAEHSWRSFSGAIGTTLVYGAAYTMLSMISQGLKAITLGALEVDSTFEQLQIGIGALIASNLADTQSMGQNIDATQKYAIGKKMAAEALKQLEEANKETPATLEQLTTAFQSAIAPATQHGMTIKQTVEYVKSMTIAAAALKMPMDQLGQEMRAVFEGDTSKNSRINSLLQIKKETIDAHAATGDLAKFLLKELEVLTLAGDDIKHSWAGIGSNLKDSFNKIRADASQQVFEKLKVDGLSLQEYLDKNGKKIAENFADVFVRIYNGGKAAFEFLAPKIQVVGQIILPVIEHADTLLKVFLAFKGASILFRYGVAFSKMAVSINTATGALTGFKKMLDTMKAHPVILALSVLASGAFLLKEAVDSNKRDDAETAKKWEDVSKQREKELSSRKSQLESQIRGFSEALNTVYKQDPSDKRVDSFRKKISEASAELSKLNGDSSTNSSNLKFKPFEEDAKKAEEIARRRKEFEIKVEKEKNDALSILDTDYTQTLEREHESRKNEIRATYEKELEEAKKLKLNTSSVNSAYLLRMQAEEKKYAETRENNERDINAKISLIKDTEFQKDLARIDKETAELVKKGASQQQISEFKQLATAEALRKNTNRIDNLKVDYYKSQYDDAAEWITKEALLREKYKELEISQIDAIVTAEKKAFDESTARDTKRLKQFKTYADGVSFYTRELASENKTNSENMVEILRSSTSGMKSAMGEFFDYSSQRFLDYKQLALNVLHDIYVAIMKNIVINPAVNAIVNGASNLASKYFGSSSSPTQEQVLQGNTNPTYEAYVGGLIPYANGGKVISFGAGGATGAGGKYEPKGIVHGGEWVMPEWMVKGMPETVGFLESIRLQGYSSGGSVGNQITPVTGQSPNFKIEIINQSGQQLAASEPNIKFDAEKTIISVVVDHFKRNKNHFQDMFRS